jgi:hypothetical protein
MPDDTQALIEKIAALSPESRAEVENFVDFIASKARRLQALDRLLAIAPALEAAGAPPLSESDIVSELDAVRRSRRIRDAGADRT